MLDGPLPVALYSAALFSLTEGRAYSAREYREWLTTAGLTSGEVQPDVTVQVSLDARKRPQPNQYEVINKFRVTSKNKATGDSLFLMELEYAGIFLVEGVPDDQIHPFLLIECPRMLFPFVRRIISDVTRDGGFPALNVDTVDYMALYRQELARRAESQKAPATLS